MGRTLAPLPERVVAELRAAMPDVRFDQATWLHGAFHFVALVPGHMALRVRMGGDHREAVSSEARASRLFAALDLSFRTPRVAIGPIEGSDWTAFGCTIFDGAPMTRGAWREDRGTLLPILDELASVEPASAAALPEPRSWCGGARWPEVVGQITAEWPWALRLAAHDAVAAAIDGAAEPTAVAHGDFGPHNVMMDAAGPILIDLDNACHAEQAVDLAPLLGFYGADEVARDFSPAMIERARAIRRSLPLQVAAAAELADDRSLREHALANFAKREQS